MAPPQSGSGAPGTTLDAKVAFLGSPEAYANRPKDVLRKETHMSWVFLVDDTVYKLKKPVRFAYLDFSTLERREEACRAELAINRRLAPGVYLDVLPLTESGDGMTIGGKGRIVDWLVVMRRLADARMLDRLLEGGAIEMTNLDRLAGILADFYRHGTPALQPAAMHLGRWRQRIAENRHVLASPRFALDPAKLNIVDKAQRIFLRDRSTILKERVRQRRVIDAHGDLRPEHISLTEPVAIIDRLEFSPGLRMCDPFDELASLAVECDLVGGGWVGEYLTMSVGRRMHDWVPDELLAFYRCYRATLRARLSIAHLLDTDCRTPEKWPRQAERYLALAARDAEIVLARLGERGRRPIRYAR